MSNPIQNLTPEMQARLAQIMAGGQPPAESPQQAAMQQQVPQQTPQEAAPPVKPPSLMDHVIALRQEVAALRSQVDAQSNVVDAVGQAVGTLYQMFQPSPTPADQGTTFGQNFQQQVDASDF